MTENPSIKLTEEEKKRFRGQVNEILISYHVDRTREILDLTTRIKKRTVELAEEFNKKEQGISIDEVRDQVYEEFGLGEDNNKTEKKNAR